MSLANAGHFAAAVALISLVVAGSAPDVSAAPDFSIDQIQLCRNSQGKLSLDIRSSYVPDPATNPAQITVLARISVTGINPPIVDDQPLTWQKPLVIGTCSGIQNCTGTCNDWTVILAKPDEEHIPFIVPANCRITSGSPPCQCVPRPVNLVPKEEPMDPHEYEFFSVTVTIDADGSYAESVESNNSLTVYANGPLVSCSQGGPGSGVPGSSAWGLVILVVLLTTGGAFAAVRRKLDEQF